LAFLTTLTLQQIQSTIIEGYNAVATLPADTGAGSSLGPMFNAFALALFNQQQEIIYVAAVSRLATIPANADGSPNPDVDSFVQAFGITPLGASAAQGQVTFSTSTPVGAQIVILVGSIVTTAGGLQFQVIADPNNGSYNPTLNGYPINVSGSSVNATVLCLTTGTIGNVQAGTITQLYGGVGAIQFPAPVNSVSNAAAFTNAINFESDAALKARFTLTQSTGRNTGTSSAIISAALGVQPGLIVSYGDQINADGTPHLSYFTLVVAIAGTATAPPSAPSEATKTAVRSALEGDPAQGINPVRPAGITYDVIGPTVFTSVNVSATIKLIPGTVAATVAASASSTVTNYINSIGLNTYGGTTTVSASKIAALLWGIAGVANVDNITLNSGPGDVTAPFAQMLIPGTMSFTTT